MILPERNPEPYEAREQCFYSSTALLGKDQMPIRLLTNSRRYHQLFGGEKLGLCRVRQGDCLARYCAAFEEAPVESITYEEEKQRMFVKGPCEQFEASILYILYAFSEVPRQEGGSFTLHAAAVSKDSQATLILGSKRAGKTALAMALCLEYGYNLIGNDVVIVGKLESGQLGILGGDGIFKPRRLTMREFPQYREMITFDSATSDFEAKAIVQPERLGVSVEVYPVPLTNSIQIFVDADRATQTKVTLPPHNTLRLNLYENASRYIRGVTTPIFNGEGRFMCCLPSFDNLYLAQGRMQLLEQMVREVGVRSVSGGSLIEIADYVENQRQS